jgi:hypothetical protein
MMASKQHNKNLRVGGKRQPRDSQQVWNEDMKEWVRLGQPATMFAGESQRMVTQ